MKHLTVTKFRERIMDLTDEVEVTANGLPLGTWKPSVFQIDTHALHVGLRPPPTTRGRGNRPSPGQTPPSASAASGSTLAPPKPCPVRSTLTDAACELPEGHPPDSPTRFHRYSYSKFDAGAPR